MNDSIPDLLYESAKNWFNLTKVHYLITYGFKEKLYVIELEFLPESFSHLAGFHYLSDINLPRFHPELYPFSTTIKANYLISSTEHEEFVFLVSLSGRTRNPIHCSCCSIFSKGSRNYEYSQRKFTILKKERLDLSTNQSIVLLDRLSKNGTSHFAFPILFISPLLALPKSSVTRKRYWLHHIIHMVIIVTIFFSKIR